MLEWFTRGLRTPSRVQRQQLSPQELRMRPPVQGPNDYTPRRPPNDYREPRVVMHRDDLPDPKVTQADYEAAARQIEEAADRTAAFVKQVHAYCYEIAAQMRTKGANVAEELMRARRMAEKVAQGTQQLVNFCLDHSASEPEEPTEALKSAAGGELPGEDSPDAERAPSSRVEEAQAQVSGGNDPTISSGSAKPAVG